MPDLLDFLVAHGQAVLFAVVLIGQLGIPVPALPLLLATGALAGAGRMSASLALGLALAASLLADALWFELGRRRGARVLRFLCRIALEPDSCVRQTERTFVQFGAWSLVVAKFVPGLSTAAPPLAGIVGMRWLRFLVFDGLGALVWAGSFLALGWIFSAQLERVVEVVLGFGASALQLFGAALALWMLWKFVTRQLFLRQLRVARIDVEELRVMLDAGEPVVIVDLRTPLDFSIEPRTIPGALRLVVEELERRHAEIPRDRDIVVYCT